LRARGSRPFCCCALDGGCGILLGVSLGVSVVVFGVVFGLAGARFWARSDEPGSTLTTRPPGSHTRAVCDLELNSSPSANCVGRGSLVAQAGVASPGRAAESARFSWFGSWFRGWLGPSGLLCCLE